MYDIGKKELMAIEIVLHRGCFFRYGGKGSMP